MNAKYAGVETFKEAWDVTEKSYQAATIHRDIPFTEAALALDDIVKFFIVVGVTPFSFPLPITDATQPPARN